MKNATFDFVIPEMNEKINIEPETLTNLHAAFKDFSYEVDAVIDLSSDISEGMINEEPTLSIKNYSMFEEYERQQM